MEPRPGFESGTSSLPYIRGAELLRLTLNDSAKTDSQNHRNTEEPRDRNCRGENYPKTVYFARAL